MPPFVGSICRSVGAQYTAQSWQSGPLKPNHWTLLTIPYCEVRYVSALQPSTPNLTRKESFKSVRKGVLQNHSDKITGRHVMRCFSYKSNLHIMTVKFSTRKFKFYRQGCLRHMSTLMQQPKKMPWFYHGSKLLERSTMA